MANKTVSLGKALRLNFRAVREISRVCPQLFPAITLCAVVTAATPYVTIYFSAQIIGELAGLRRAAVLWRWVCWAVGCGGVLALVNAALLRWKEAKLQASFHTQDRLFVNKLFGMDFAQADKPSTHTLRSEIEQEENWSGWGLSRVSEEFHMLVEAAAGIVSAVILAAGLFTQPVPAGPLTVLNSPLCLLALLGVMLAVCVGSGWCKGKATSYVAGMSESIKLANRMGGMVSRIVREGKYAADLRMYNQQKLIVHYADIETKQIWGPKGLYGRLSAGPIGLYSSLGDSVSAVFTGFVYGFVCLKAWAGAFGVGAIAQYVGAVTALARNVAGLFEYAGRLRSNAPFLARTFEFLDIPNSMYQGALTTEKRSDRKYDVEFRDVSFRYPGAASWSLRHVSVKFRVGSRLAVVGENGSGKTTFIKLLCRLYDPQEGAILLNGIDIRKYNYKQYMDIFSVVFQDFQLLSQPLGANVAGAARYDEARVRRALEDAGFAGRLATLPKGLDTQLYKDYGDEKGVEVSGGEAQKIAIARALYKDAPFIILDEPTAALDPIAEAEIYAQFNRISGDRTAIYISHRLSSCRFCDEILVFDQGRIIQSGSHDALVADKAGKYYALWQAQAQYYSDEGIPLS